MKNIQKIASIVEDSLRQNPKTRNSDAELYIDVCTKINPDVAYLGFLYVFNNRNDLGIPNYESVRRSRQKLQHDNPDLRADESVTDARYEAWKEVRSYVEQ